MSVESGLVARLKAEVTSVSNRVAPQPLPHAWLDEANLPALTYIQVPGGTRKYSQSGDSNLSESWIQLDAWAKTMEQAVETMTEINTALSGYKGTLGDVTSGGIFLRTPFGTYEQETEMYREIVVAQILWSS